MRQIRLRGSVLTPSDHARLTESGKFEIKHYSGNPHRKMTGLESLAQYEGMLSEKEEYVQAFELQTTNDQETSKAFEDIIVVRPSSTTLESMVGMITQFHQAAVAGKTDVASVLFDIDDDCDSIQFKNTSLMVDALGSMGMKIYRGVDELISK